MKKITFAILSLALIFVSCKKDELATKNGGKLAEYVPKDASSVARIDIAAMMKKMDYEAMKELEMFKEAKAKISEEEPILLNIMENPAESGIDLTTDAYGFMLVGAVKNSVLGGMAFGISDKAKLEALINQSEMKGSRTTGDGYTYLSNRDNYIAWSDEVVVMGASQGGMLTSGLADFFNKKNNIKENKEASKALKQTGDIVSFVSMKGMMKNMYLPRKVNTGLALAGITEEDIEATTILSTTSFENGKIISNTKHNLADNIEEYLRYFIRDEIETNFTKVLNLDADASVIALGIDVKGIYQWAKENNLLAAASMTENQVGVSVENLAKAIQGDACFVVHKDGTPQLAVRINEMATVKQLIDKIAESTNSLIAEGNNIYKLNNFDVNRMTNELGKGSIYLKLTEDFLLFSTKDGLSNTGGEKSVSKSIQSGSLYVRLDADNDLMGSSMRKEGGLEAFFMQSANGTSNMELTVDDNSKNVLKYFIEKANQSYLKNKNSIKYYERDFSEEVEPLIQATEEQ